MTLIGAQDNRFVIETEVDVEELRDQLRDWAPWPCAIEFSNGVSTAEFERTEPFVDQPLAAFTRFAEHLPSGLQDGRALDVGCKLGLNSLQLSRHYGLAVTGVDASAENIERSRYLAQVGGFETARFQLADPNYFLLADRFDLILHLETLELLRDPFLALRNTVQMLKPGGCLVLEHDACRGPAGDETLCRFHPHRGPQDRGSLWWSLGAAAVSNMLRAAGCARVELIHESSEPAANYRRLVIAYRSSSPPGAPPPKPESPA